MKKNELSLFEQYYTTTTENTRQALQAIAITTTIRPSEFKEWDVEHYRKYGITPELLGQSSKPIVEDGEDLYMMVGDFEDDPRNTPEADHLLVKEGYISIVAHNVDCTDYEELERLKTIF